MHDFVLSLLNLRVVGKEGGNHCSFEPFFAYEVTYGSATTFFVCEV